MGCAIKCNLWLKKSLVWEDAGEGSFDAYLISYLFPRYVMLAGFAVRILACGNQIKGLYRPRIPEIVCFNEQKIILAISIILVISVIFWQVLQFKLELWPFSVNVCKNFRITAQIMLMLKV